MGYSKHSRAVEKVKNHLDELIAAQGKKEIRWYEKDPTKTAYHLREAFRFDAYQPLRAMYIVRIRGHYVIAEPRVAPTQPAAQTEIGTMNIPEVTDLLEVIGAAIKHKRETMFFPSVELDDSSMEKLYAWASKNGYHIVAGDEGVTLTRNDPGVLAWTP